MSVSAQSSTPSIAIVDPSWARLLGIDSQLPSVPLGAQTPQALRMRFAQPPEWTPERMLEKPITARQPMDAAVLVPIVLREQPMVLLTVRSAKLSTHSGQVAFPGGKRDPQDVSAEATALREAHEEVGLSPKNVEVLGRLPVYVTGTAFHITPVVALVHPQPSYFPNPGEVADLFEVPLSFLLNPAHHQRHAMQWQGVDREWFAMPYQDGEQQRYIWGATAGMLRNLYRFLAA
ncbi:CoA pyrophosphatase [Comamonas sp. Y33R10-2]|uniref:CoA pyrophosphatase n=1 Tax=Comamonas sp. Y33R10-2 TaxID=2853257 RepID=UPI001C5CBB6A|nr:CoA pyrophosphatase [Comamonas sp. Y33R10-2]QXZ10035.1 CoA pyrophosphatase [Comamonas sp. Y33R10-2]